MISADFLIFIGVFYIYSSFQKYLTCQDWIKKSLSLRFHNCAFRTDQFINKRVAFKNTLKNIIAYCLIQNIKLCRRFPLEFQDCRTGFDSRYAATLETRDVSVKRNACTVIEKAMGSNLGLNHDITKNVKSCTCCCCYIRLTILRVIVRDKG